MMVKIWLFVTVKVKIRLRLSQGNDGKDLVICYSKGQNKIQVKSG